jgi:creatinine amidohydrolase
MAETIDLLELPHVEARRLVATGAPVWLTVNPVEFHGPHLSLRNDRLISQGLTRDLHARLAERHPDWPLVLGADLEVGVEPVSGPGAAPVSYAAVREAAVASCRALADLGARRVVIMTFHGDPLHNLALDAGVTELARRGVAAIAPLHLALRRMLYLDDVAPYADAFAPVADPAARAELAAGLKHDFHAGFFETSLSLHYAPHSVSPAYASLPACPRVEPKRDLAAAARLARRLGRDLLARELDAASVSTAWTELRPFPGYTSNPALATAASGAAFARHLGDEFVPAIDDVLCGRASPPRPVLGWSASLSLGGRLFRRGYPPPADVTTTIPTAPRPSPTAASPTNGRRPS